MARKLLNDALIMLRLPSWLVQMIDRAKNGDETRPDFIRDAIREKASGRGVK